MRRAQPLDLGLGPQFFDPSRPLLYQSMLVEELIWHQQAYPNSAKPDVCRFSLNAWRHFLFSLRNVLDQVKQGNCTVPSEPLGER